MRLSLISVLAACGHPAAPPPPACDAAVIAAQDDVARYTSCTQLASLTIKTGGSLDVSPLAVARIDRLVVGPSVGFEELRLPALAEARTIDIASNASLHGIYLPVLQHAGTITIAANADLSTVVLPHLAEVSGAMHVTDNPVLEFLDISALAKVGELSLAHNPLLTVVDAPHPP